VLRVAPVDRMAAIDAPFSSELSVSRRIHM
jgi:hypothetical protein